MKLIQNQELEIQSFTNTALPEKCNNTVMEEFHLQSCL